MEGAFFVSRTELLEWINTSLSLSLSRVEQCASGCVYLQALDCLLGPKSRVPMSKVKWGAKHEYEYVHNYKLLQAAFDAHNIQKYIEVNKLIKAKYQDNLEFLQWLKAFCDRQAGVYATDVTYDPIERRRVRAEAAFLRLLVSLLRLSVVTLVAILGEVLLWFLSLPLCRLSATANCLIA